VEVEVEVGTAGTTPQQMREEVLQQMQQAREETLLGVTEVGRRAIQRARTMFGKELQMQQARAEIGILAKEIAIKPKMRISPSLLRLIVLGTVVKNPPVEQMKDGIVSQHLVVDGMLWKVDTMTILIDEAEVQTKGSGMRMPEVIESEVRTEGVGMRMLEVEERKPNVGVPISGLVTAWREENLRATP